MKNLLPLLWLALGAAFTPLLSTAQSSAPVLSDTQLAEGIRSGFGTIITQALTSGSIKVPAPKLFLEAESVLAKANKTDVSKRFNTALNDTVTRLTPKIAEAIRAALKDLKIEDAKGLLAGSSKAGTQFLQKAIQSSLRDKLLPEIRREIATANLTTSAKAVIDAAYPGGANGATAAVGNLDYHLRDKAIAEAFKLIGEKEAAARANPASLTGNTLAQKVFATAKK